MNEEDVSYLDVKPEHLVPVPPHEKVWAQIDDKCQLGFIDWNMINMLSEQFDELHKRGQEKTESHVICKLLTLVRDQTRKDCEQAK